MEWKDFFNEMKKTEYYTKLSEFIIQEYKEKTCYPEYEDIMKAFHLTDYNKIKCVIIGQDPYHTKRYANGLAFSVSNDMRISPSLKNIFKELYDDLGIKRTNSDLSDWAKDGVLLLNASLTVIEGNPGSHMIYWEKFTNGVIKFIEKNDKPIVYILWGNFAKSKKFLISNKNHFIIESTHPSPLGAHKGFFGSKPFSKCNEILRKNDMQEIKWCRSLDG